MANYAGHSRCRRLADRGSTPATASIDAHEQCYREIGVFAHRCLTSNTRSDACPVSRVPAAEIEAAVVDQLRSMLRSPEIIVGTWRAARSEIEGLSEDVVREALERLDPVWDALFPAEQARMVQLLVARVDVAVDGIEIHLRTNGLTSTYRQLAAIVLPQEAAA
ncbi:MAG: zinc ribbon domain-containing protein [Reyranella sp.]